MEPFPHLLLSRIPTAHPLQKPWHTARVEGLGRGKINRLEDLENELEAYEPLIKCEMKCEQTYYKCPMRNRFECPMIIRNVREVISGSILIETCAMSQCHDDSNEKFQRGLSFREQESIREITKFNIKIRPRTLHRSLLIDTYKFSVEDVPISKVSSYLHRIRA
jgi:hypothetical protein